MRQRDRTAATGANGLRRAAPRLLALLASLSLCACTSLLPTTRKEVVSDWNSYDEAVQSLKDISPYQATRADVHKQGLDPRQNPSITVLHYADVMKKFTAAAMIGTQDVDRGIRDCLHAGKRCSAYAVAVKTRASHREGNFFLDSLNFRRETVTVGWSIDALLVFVDDALVYELVGGQPAYHEYEEQRNPLGPLQGWANWRP